MYYPLKEIIYSLSFTIDINSGGIPGSSMRPTSPRSQNPSGGYFGSQGGYMGGASGQHGL